MLALSYWIEQINSSKNEKLIISRYISAAKELIPLIVNEDKKELEKKLQELHLQKTSLQKTQTPVWQKPFTFGEILISKSNDKYYLTIRYLDEILHLFDTTQKLFQEEKIITFMLLLFDLIILFTIYFFVLKTISPIKELSLKMKLFSQGDYDIRMQESGDEEIKEAAKSFNKMAKILQQNIEDRENLLKYIGHELKTPLAKAKFALEMREFTHLQKSIEEIELFVKEILHMHLITMQNLNKTTFKAQTLITEAIGKLYILDDENIEIELEDFAIEADLNYLSIALKNLIENALKYTQNYPIKIVAKNHKIEVISYGEKLKKDFSFYLKPFNKESSNGYGLGLSLVNLIVSKHRFSLYYKHESGKNIFGIGFKSLIKS